jgi:hypothetical protein
MTFRTCSDEDRILTSARAGALSAEQRAHVAGCPSCAAALETESALSALSEALAAQARPRLAPSDVILLRAKLRARREAAERSLRPLELWQRFAALAAAIGLVVGLSISGSLFGGLASAPARPDPSHLLFAVALAALAALPFARRTRPFA